MEIVVPSIEAVRAALAPLTLKQLETLAGLSGVPSTTIYKIKRGLTENPGIETIRKIMPHVNAALQEPAPVPDAGDMHPGALTAAGRDAV